MKRNELAEWRERLAADEMGPLEAAIKLDAIARRRLFELAEAYDLASSFARDRDDSWTDGACDNQANVFRALVASFK